MKLTSYLDLSSVRAAWKAYFPRTASYVSFINDSYKWLPLVIPPSTWVRVNRRYGCLGTAYDYLVGAIWANQSLDSVFERVESVISALNSEKMKKHRQALKEELKHTKRVTERNQLMIGIYLVNRCMRRYSEFPSRFNLLKQYLTSEIKTIQTKRDKEPTSDFLRALGALADLDVVFRDSRVPFPAWIKSSRVTGMRGLRATLRKNYPGPFAKEIQALYSMTKKDIPQTDPIIYNPVFGGADGVPLGADGDLLMGDLLIDLKVSIKRLKTDYLWQLLGYVALDHLKGNKRIRRVGFYNPRFRMFWKQSVKDLIISMGGRTVEHFGEWFQKNASPPKVEKALQLKQKKVSGAFFSPR